MCVKKSFSQESNLFCLYNDTQYAICKNLGSINGTEGKVNNTGMCIGEDIESLNEVIEKCYKGYCL